MNNNNIIKVANCSLNQWVMDFEGNEKNIIDCINDAKKKGCSINFNA